MTGPEDGVEPFDCPRCGLTVHERFWGPCRSCREQLVAGYGGSERGEDGELETTQISRFEPAMHVVPNHVATKD